MFWGLAPIARIASAVTVVAIASAIRLPASVTLVILTNQPSFGHVRQNRTTGTFIVPAFYSLLKASTGSFFAAARAGINPPINVSTILIIINTTAEIGTKVADKGMSPVKWCKIALIIGIKRYEIAIPKIPDKKPTIKVSALKIEEILCLLAPIALKIPISLVRSYTEI